jgi:hypothetical protein
VDIGGFLKPWSKLAYRHIPADSPFGPLDLRFAGSSQVNRWNVAGTRTLYLASDRGVILAEFARHLHEDLAAGAEPRLVARRIYRMHVDLELSLDLRDRTLWDALSLTNAPECFLDRTVARAVAGFARHATPAQAMIVPSMAFLDQPDRWNVVLFLEKLPADPSSYLSSVVSVGTVRLGP